MIAGIIITHGDFAKGIKHAAEMICGKQVYFEAIGLYEGDGLLELMNRIESCINQMECKEILLFVDLFGATPCNASSMICAQSNYPVVSAVQLPLLLEFLIKREHESIQEILSSLQHCASQSFRIIQQQDLI